MASPSPRDVLRVPGRLCVNPSDLATAFPHGGTALGNVREATWAGGEVATPVRAEEWGGQVVEQIHGRVEAVFGCVLRGWDADALQAVHLDTSTGGTTGRTVVAGRLTTDDKRPGAPLSDKAKVLYFSPLADQHPGLLVFWAIPVPDDQVRQAFSPVSDLETAVFWFATPDDQGRLYETGLRDDLTL